jgi:uncharacterized protein (TIGR04255 family)
VLTVTDGAPVTGEDYARPPIVEAVIERRFANPIDFEVVNQLRRKFEGQYPAVDQTAEFALAINADGAAPELRQSPLGYKMVSHAGTAIVVISTQGVAFSRLAPYPGWSEFSAGASEVFKVAREITGYVPITRIGARYINRLDLPMSGGPIPTVVRMEDYILVRPEYPETLTPYTRGFTLQCVFEVQVPDCSGTITVATVPSPVPGRNGVVFDIDIGKNTDVPQNEEGIQKLLDLIRIEKNRIFEASLTARMKELFR